MLHQHYFGLDNHPINLKNICFPFKKI